MPHQAAANALREPFDPLLVDVLLPRFAKFLGANYARSRDLATVAI